MEAAASRGASLPVSSQPQRKEWRAIPEHQLRNNGTEGSEHVKLGQSDERTIYEVQEGAGPRDVDFCSITIDDRGLQDDLLQQRLQEIARQREGLHQMEIGLRAQAITRSEILQIQSSFESQIKDHADAASKLKDQLHKTEQHLLELEVQLEEKDRELRDVKIDNEAAWAKEDLLREQSKELATFRKEHDNSEAERGQHLKKIHELQEHIQEKENQFLALDEQHRAAQETILFKDEQLREAQAWIARAQEMDVLHSTANQSLQAELRERTEQFDQYWIGFQRQFADMERHHLQAIQQLQLELAEARERTVMHKDGSQVTRKNSADGSYVQSKGSQINVISGTSNGNPELISNGNLDDAIPFVSTSNASTKTEHASGVPLANPSMLGMGAFFPPGQMSAFHPFVIHPQGVPHTVTSPNSHNSQPHVGLQPTSTTPVQHWQNEQAVPDVSEVPNESTVQPSQTEQSILISNDHYSYRHSAERQVIYFGHLNTSINPHERSGLNGSSDGMQVLDSNGSQYQVPQELQETANENLQFHASLEYEPQKQKSELKLQDEKPVVAIHHSQEQVLSSGQQRVPSRVASSVVESHPASSNNAVECNEGAQTASSMIHSKALELNLLDERSLLACIVRAIPAGSNGRIRISSTLPNRLGKMLAPLHWHDYKKHYGKLDDFVAHHPELFVIDGDYIHLREGAQEIISATTAYAKVAAAAAVSNAPNSSLLPSVAVTPVAQNNRHKKASFNDSKQATSILRKEDTAVMNPVDSGDRHSQTSKVLSQQPNGVSFNIVQGLADVKVSSKSKDIQIQNGLKSDTSTNHSSIHTTSSNGTSLDRSALTSSQNKGSSNGRHGSGGKQQLRTSGAGVISRR